MYAIIENQIVKYVFENMPRFKNNILVYPIKAMDIRENNCIVVECSEEVKPNIYGYNGNFYISNQNVFLEKVKTKKIETMASEYDFEQPYLFDDPQYGDGRTYNGGEKSAKDIYDAVKWAKELGNETIGIWDVNDKTEYLTILQAEMLAKQIASAFAPLKYEFQNRKAQVKDLKLEDYQTIEDAVNAINDI